VQAIKVATQLEGPRGLFRGTVATLSREIPFYVLGIVFFEQFKKAAKGPLPSPPFFALLCTSQRDNLAYTFTSPLNTAMKKSPPPPGATNTHTCPRCTVLSPSLTVNVILFTTMISTLPCHDQSFGKGAARAHSN